MDSQTAQSLAKLRSFNYTRIYTREESLAQAEVVVKVLQQLVEYYLEHLDLVPQEFLTRPTDRVHQVVAYVAGMTDSFAFDQAQIHLGWDKARVPKGLGRGY